MKELGKRKLFFDDKKYLFVKLVETMKVLFLTRTNNFLLLHVLQDERKILKISSRMRESSDGFRRLN